MRKQTTNEKTEPVPMRRIRETEVVPTIAGGGQVKHDVTNTRVIEIPKDKALPKNAEEVDDTTPLHDWKAQA